MSQYLPDEHYIFTPESPLYESKFGDNHPTIQDVVKFLNKNGETSEIIHGQFNGKPERFVIVHSPKNIDGLHELACDLGQECGIYSKNGKHQLHFYNGPKRGEIKTGSGTSFTKEKPNGDYLTIHTDQGPLHFNHNIKEEPLNRSEEDQKANLDEKLLKLKNLKNTLETKKHKFVYIPDHLVIKNSCSHWR